MYYSFSGGFINGSSHIKIKEAVINFVLKARTYLKNAKPVSTTDLPAINFVNFYFLTNKSLFLIKENITNLGNKSIILSALFEAGNKVISEINVYSQVKLKHRYLINT
jgi:hypothetical protein